MVPWLADSKKPEPNKTSSLYRDAASSALTNAVVSLGLLLLLLGLPLHLLLLL